MWLTTVPMPMMILSSQPFWARASSMLLGDAVDLFGVPPVGQGLDDGHVSLVDGDDEVVWRCREETLHHVHRGDLCRANLAHQEHGPVGLGGNVQLLGADVDVAQQDVVGDDALDKGGLVVLLLVVSSWRCSEPRSTMEQTSLACSSLPWTKAA